MTAKYNKLLELFVDNHFKKEDGLKKNNKIIIINSEFFDYGIIELLELMINDNTTSIKNENIKLSGLRFFKKEYRLFEREVLYVLQKYKTIGLINNNDIEIIIENNVGDLKNIDKHTVWEYIIRNKDDISYYYDPDEYS